MVGKVKRTIWLPAHLVAEAEELARGEGKTLSEVIQQALRELRAGRLEWPSAVLQHVGVPGASFESTRRTLRLPRRNPLGGSR